MEVSKARPLYVTLAGGVLLAVLITLLGLVLRDDGDEIVSTVVPARQPTAGSATVEREPAATATATPTTPEATATPATPTPEATVTPATPTPEATAAPNPTTVPTAMPNPYPVAALSITITHPEAAVVSYDVVCQRDDATPICVALAADPVRSRLINGVPADRVCTEIYGGPDLAHIVGTYDRVAVETMVDRTNGCGIDDWDRVLAGILRPAIGVSIPTPTHGSTGWVTGHVLAGPTCPVERPDVSCPPVAVVGVVQFLRAGQVVTSTTIDPEGAYSAELLPTEYSVIIDVGTSPFPFCGSVNIAVVADAVTVADVSCHTGIR